MDPIRYLGGVPVGEATHDEIYFEPNGTGSPHPLHVRGCSFRLRVTTQASGGDPYSGRILLVLTRYPISSSRPIDYRPEWLWHDLDLDRFPAFRPLDSLRPELERSTALPCIFECMVAYLQREPLLATLNQAIIAVPPLGRGSSPDSARRATSST